MTQMSRGLALLVVLAYWAVPAQAGLFHHGGKGGGGCYSQAYAGGCYSQAYAGSCYSQAYTGGCYSQAYSAPVVKMKVKVKRGGGCFHRKQRAACACAACVSAPTYGPVSYGPVSYQPGTYQPGTYPSPQGGGIPTVGTPPPTTKITPQGVIPVQPTMPQKGVPYTTSPQPQPQL